MSFVFRYSIPKDQLYDIGYWHSPYFFLGFFEARMALFESFGVTQEDLRAKGFAIVVGELQCKYYLPLKQGDVALIEIMIDKIGNSSMSFSCRVYKEGDPEKKIYASGTLNQILFDRKNLCPTPIPGWLKERLLLYSQKQS